MFYLSLFEFFLPDDKNCDESQPFDCQNGFIYVIH